MKEKMTEDEIGKTILSAVSACRRLAADSSGVLSLDEKNMCSLIGHRLTVLFNSKLEECRDRLSVELCMPPEDRDKVLMPIYHKKRT